MEIVQHTRAVPMLLPFAAVIAGLLMLIWSADRFVEGASATARHLAVPPLLVGMVIVGFGTSAPEMVVSALAAWQGTRRWRWATPGGRTSSTWG
jgi:cation:H+ antiporter